MSDMSDLDARFGGAPPLEGEVVQRPVTGQAVARQDNPFAVAAPDHVSAGAVAIETGRGIAEVQGRMLLAKRFPRDTALAYANAMVACRRIGLATDGLYKYKRGGTNINKASIRLAEELARCWTNIEYGLNELSRRPGESEMEAFAWDLETNVRSSQRFTVRHIRDKTDGGQALTQERDVYEITANMGSRRVRARILAILPPELVRDAEEGCRETAKNGGGIPLEDRIKKLLPALVNVGVTPQMLIEYLGHAIDRITPDELVDLGAIWVSIRDGERSAKDIFGATAITTKSAPAAGADAFEASGSGAATVSGGAARQPTQDTPKVPQTDTTPDAPDIAARTDALLATLATKNKATLPALLKRKDYQDFVAELGQSDRSDLMVRVRDATQAASIRDPAPSGALV